MAASKQVKFFFLRFTLQVSFFFFLIPINITKYTNKERIPLYVKYWYSNPIYFIFI